MSERITLTINKTPIHFDVTPEHHDKLVDETLPNYKVDPMHNFLKRCVAAESKEALEPLLTKAPYVMHIGGMVVNQFAPALSITVGE